ncbi:MAG: hypothetical protein OXG70_05005, partial [Cyanobacteria bacterium MAG IRC1_bin_28]|nr:hypothetical protein [Cyanobacteria bacterium MAG IRC1_bin_28]
LWPVGVHTLVGGMRREPAGDACHVSDPIDMGIGLNSASPNGAAGRVFLNWLTSTEFAALHARAIPGFFPLSDHAAEELGARLQGGLAGWYAPGQQAPAGGGPGGF